ncbi:uncharacterized protein PAC_14965 [Phialocephala subalpina]|uniref:Uncharacterized protein n=1 Tax=Phialocephala subalpina TaxID=576137 RepID=A0A1L7XJ42_9HELO|nr:uncharacterized protein PAC_14965 [Phialocephala subalpina]
MWRKGGSHVSDEAEAEADATFGCTMLPSRLSRRDQSPPSSSGYLRVSSAEDYAHLVEAHARQAADNSLYPGLNYENLSRYLLEPYTQSYKPRSRDPSGETSRNGRIACFAMLHDLSAAPHERETPFLSPDAFERSEAIQNLGISSTGYLLFMRGNPTPEWLNTIGYSCNVDPDFFLKHLDFRSTAGKQDYFNLPSLPSTNENFIRLRWTTIGSRLANFEINGHDQGRIDLLRKDSAKKMEQYLQDIRSTHKMSICDSFVRRFAVHDENHFSLEQDVSICVNTVGNGWIIVVWQDVGNDSMQGLSGPWLEPPNHSFSWKTQALPTIQHKPYMALEARSTPMRKCSEVPGAGKFTQSASLLYLNCGKTLDQELLSYNPFYVLTDLFKFTAFAEAQFLNMMETKLKKEIDFSVTDKRHTPTFSNILYSKTLLDQHVDQIEDAIASIKSNNDTPFVDGSVEIDREVLAVSTKLLRDFESLSNRAKALSLHCENGMKIVANNNILLESQRASSRPLE